VSPIGESLLINLVGAEVESIVFIRDYLQVTLYLPESSPRLTYYVWPAVTTPGIAAGSVGNPGYRDELCALIGRLVVGASVGSKTGLTLHFDADASLTIRPAWSELRGPEIAMLQMNDALQRWEVWRPGEPPFESDPSV
jgi:hypothetical protein